MALPRTASPAAATPENEINPQKLQDCKDSVRRALASPCIMYYLR